MIKKEIYIADDGKEFDNKKDCFEYEENVCYKKAANFIQSYCKNHSCIKCAFGDKDYNCILTKWYPCDWNIDKRTV